MKKKLEKSKFSKERGSEILQVVLISGILLVLIITLFYPQMEDLFNSIMETMAKWFEETGSKPFTI